eukprot:COSAG06_NODE_6443_length_2930_cov_1.938538_3_plen_133_part_00
MLGLLSCTCPKEGKDVSDLVESDFKSKDDYHTDLDEESEEAPVVIQSTFSATFICLRVVPGEVRLVVVCVKTPDNAQGQLSGRQQHALTAAAVLVSVSSLMHVQKSVIRIPLFGSGSWRLLKGGFAVSFLMP